MGVHVFTFLNPLLPSPSPSHPSGSSQCISPEHPVSRIKLGLAICFTCDNIHVSMLFSQIIPPSPSPTESKSLFFTSVSLLLSHIYGHHYHLSKSERKTPIQYINTYIWNLERWYIDLYWLNWVCPVCCDWITAGPLPPPSQASCTSDSHGRRIKGLGPISLNVLLYMAGTMAWVHLVSLVTQLCTE